MKVVFHRNFKKQYKKLGAVQKKFDQRLILFTRDPLNPVLNNHALAGKYRGFSSINVTGDYRAIYELVNGESALFITIDTHSNLYK